MRSTLLCLFLLFLGTCVRAQVTKQYVQSLQEAETDNERYGILYDLTGHLLDQSGKTNRDLAIQYSKQLVTVAKNIGRNDFIAPAAYTLGLAYRNNRNERLADDFFAETMRYAMDAKDANLIVLAVSERTRLAAKNQNYREATRINQEALDFFTKNGDNNIATLRAKLEAEKARLRKLRTQVDQQTTALAGEVDRLAIEADRLQGEKDRLQGDNANLQRENETRTEELAAKEEALASTTKELTAAQEQTKIIEQKVAKSRKQNQALSRKALEAKALADEAEKLQAEEALRRQSAEMVATEQTNRFYLAAGAGVGLLLLALTFLSRLRVKQRAAKKLSAANTALADANEKADSLLTNILPRDIAEELKTTGKAKARRFLEVTVLFCDFVNFTQTAEQLGATALVEELDACFKAFDGIIDEYDGVEKIKTIGDAYMVASGLTDRKTMPIDIIRVALRMQEFLTEEAEKRQMLGLPFFTGRIGLHTGPVVAGVVGARKFAYDIWGDTVNVASRIESKSEPGKVNISETTYNLIRYTFRCQYRGKVDAKNKGLIDMYFVEGETSPAR